MKKFFATLSILACSSGIAMANPADGIAFAPREVGIDAFNQESQVQESKTQESQIENQTETAAHIPQSENLEHAVASARFKKKSQQKIDPTPKIQIDETALMHGFPVTTEDSGGTLILSDSPEYASKNGILYSDVVQGDARILFYHLNNSYGNKKIAIVLENTSNQLNTITITRGGHANPSAEYLKVGKEMQTKYFNQKLNDTIYMLGGSIKLLRPELDDVTIKPGELLHGVYDFNATRDVKVTILFYPATAEPLLFYKRAPILKADKHHLRGTFHGMNRTIKTQKAYDPENDGTVYIQLGDDVNDKYKRGIDALDGSEVVNYGNYGIFYTLDIPTKKETQFYLSPLGGVYAGAMTIKTAKNDQSKLILTPGEREYFGDRTVGDPEHVARARERGIAFLTQQTELSDLGRYNGNLFFEYSPPGASNLPVNIILRPTE